MVISLGGRCPSCDDEDLPTTRLKDCEPINDPEPGYSKMFKNKIRSRRYYIVLTLLIFMFAVLIAAVFGLSYAYLAKANQNSKLCTTEDCLRSATALVESMNTSVDPCDDFYEFACGHYGIMHRIPKSAHSTDRFSELHALMLTFIRDYMEKEDSNLDPEAVWQSRRLYRSCIATDEMDAAGLNQLVEILDKIGLPHLGLPAKKKNINLSSILASAKKHISLDYLFTTDIETDPKNRSINQIAIGKPRGSTVFPIHKTTENMRIMSSRKGRETEFSEEKVDKNEEDTDEGVYYLKSFGKYFKKVWLEIYKSQLNSSNPSDIKLESLAAQILLFNNELAEIKDEVYDTDGQLPSIMSVDDLQLFMDNITLGATESHDHYINWKEYFSILFADVKNITLDFETDLIQVNNIEYFEALFRIIGEKGKNQHVLNLWWEVVTTLLPFTTNQMRFIQDTFYYETTGLENNPSRSLYCANAVNTMMGMAVSNLLIDLEYLEHNKQMMVEMMKNIHEAFEKIVNELKWMDDITKNRTLNKARLMKTFVGFPEFIKDQMELDNYYADLEVVENDYFGNVIRYIQRNLNNSLISLREINNYDINSWASDPLEVNAFNWIQANAITIPAGILQFPFFGHDLQVLNYGYLGSILGHELTHSFDNTGRKFDQDGNENMWWTNQTTNEYEKRTSCFIQHYESYTVPGIEEKINGKLTLDENIADNGGIREALWAYRTFVAGNGEEKKLPGLEDFSHEQIYFLAFANNWCESATNESISNSLLDEHSPNYIRVNAGLTNSEEFSEVWKCEKGTRMNPINEKCKIW
ncbi:endothelin-converting enzyme homolog isoform X2 [Sipha flava]|uniref:Endothelin-converting enzyme homolog isoform X2 n=1 Tax=Sipha flava TaxID=143950 RepID=A0A8B8G7W4_9HEMI|nr:endothelin-converting enzyme homolog isoform X2 [Sipha flava]